MTVVSAIERDLAGLGGLADSGLAASALVLAGLLDDPGNSATSKSMCARSLLETMNRLRELAALALDGEEDRLDELGSRRAARIAGRSAS